MKRKRCEECGGKIVGVEPAWWKSERLCQDCFHRKKWRSKQIEIDKRRNPKLEFKEPWMRLIRKK